MYGQCASERSAAQQRMFEAAMLELMSQRLFENISVSELCRYTGLSRKTFYRLYETKADVVYAMIDHAIMDASSYVPDPSVGPGGLHRFLAYWRSRKDLLDVLKKNQISALLQQQTVIHVLNEVPELVHVFGADSSRNGRDLLVFYISGIFSLVLDWHGHGFDRSIDELAASLMELMMTPPVKCPMPEHMH